VPQNVVEHCALQSAHVHEYHADHSAMASADADASQFETHPLLTTLAQLLTHVLSVTHTESPVHAFCLLAQSFDVD
jgi:hypothetical protein